MIPDLDRASRARGMVLGHLIGDALGAPYEFKGCFTGPLAYGRGVFGHEPGTGTDDTAVFRAAIAACEGATFSPTTYLTELSRWLDTGPLDVGGQTSRAIRHWRSHGHTIPPNAERRDAGNGAIMGCAPLAFLADGPDAAEELARTTHPHPDSIWACRQLVTICTAIIDGTFADFSPSQSAPLHDELRGWDPTGPNLGWCKGTLWLAYRALDDAIAGARPAHALADVVRLGGDTDTNAAVAGALLGCAYGDAAWSELVDGLDPTEQARNVELAASLV